MRDFESDERKGSGWERKRGGRSGASKEEAEIRKEV